MEHNPFISFEDGLEITYSDLKKTSAGEEYITIYFEEPNADRSGFNSAQYDYPGDSFQNVKGYDKEDIDNLMKYIVKSAATAFAFSKEDAYA